MSLKPIVVLVGLVGSAAVSLSAPDDKPAPPQQAAEQGLVEVKVGSPTDAADQDAAVSVHAGPGGVSVIVATPVLPEFAPVIRAIRPRVVVVSVSSHDRIDRLVYRLQHGTPLLSQRAARILAWLKNPYAVEPLIRVLGDDNPHVRRSSAEVLRSITGQDFGEDQARWQAWYQGSLEQAVPQP